MPKLPEGEEHTELVFIRIDIVVQMILKNDRFLYSKRCQELVKTVMTDFKCAERTAERYVAEAKKEINKMGKVNKKKAYSKAIRDREYIVSEAKTKDDLKLALDAMKDRDKLNGLYVDEVKQTGELTMKNVDMSKLTEYGLERLKRGDKVEDVLSDSKSIKVEASK